MANPFAKTDSWVEETERRLRIQYPRATDKEIAISIAHARAKRTMRTVDAVDSDGRGAAARKRAAKAARQRWRARGPVSVHHVVLARGQTMEQAVADIIAKERAAETAAAAAAAAKPATTE